jgi:hypothetical protein
MDFSQKARGLFVRISGFNWIYDLFLCGKICELGSQGRGPLVPWVYRGQGTTRSSLELARPGAVAHWQSLVVTGEVEDEVVTLGEPSPESGRRRGSGAITMKDSGR